METPGLALNDPVRRAEWAQRPHGFFQTVREAAALFDAAVNDGLTRDQAWLFLQLGLFLERAGGTARLLEAQLRAAAPSPGPDLTLDEQLEWICLLRACDSLELYRRRCRTEYRPGSIVRFLIADPLSPRSIRYAFDRISATLSALAEVIPSQAAVTVDRGLAVVFEESGSGVVDPPATLRAIEADCDRLHQTIQRTYIVPQQIDASVGHVEVAWNTR